MEMENSKPEESTQVPVENIASPVPETVAAPVETVPAVTPVPVKDLAGSVSGTGTPKASPSTGGLGAGAPVPAVKMELPKTTGQTVGGWNRFAGYNPNAAKNKPKDGRGGPGRK